MPAQTTAAYSPRIRSLVSLLVTMAIAAAMVLQAPAAEAQTLLPITSCTFTRSGDTATINWTPTANDGADRYVIERNRNNLGWNWAAVTTKGGPLVKTNTVAANDAVEYRILSRVGNAKSATTTCTETGGWVTQAIWYFNATSGPIKDSAAGNFDGTTGVDTHPGTVVRQGGSVLFDGQPGSIVLIPVDGASSNFNPDGGQFRWTTKFSMTANQIQAAIDNQVDPNTPATSFNLMQRAFANNSGGQWKTQIVVSGGQAYAQCVARDGRGDANGGLVKDRSSVAIQPNVKQTVRCEYDDEGDRLQTTVNGTSENWVNAPASFLDVNPSGTTTCGNGSASLGDTITIGNKPACGNTVLTPDDPFQGTVFFAQVEKSS